MPSPASILVVDDEPRWLETLGHVLTSAGYDVRPASGGEAALDSVATRLPDVILLDIRMPGVGGFDVLRELKEKEETRGIPVLLLSAFAEVEERIEGLRLGASDSIAKPCHAGELLARVRMQVEMSALRALHESQTDALKNINGELGREVARRQQAEAALQSRLLSLTQPVDSPEEIRLPDLINIDDLQQLQDQFSNATGVASIITQPDGTPITEPSNFCRLCSEVIRKTDTGVHNCQHSDAALGAPCPSGPIIQPCLSGGLMDAGASITVGGRHIANWLIGQVRNDSLDEGQILHYSDEIGADREEFRQALAEVPVMSKARFEQTAQALFTFAREISSRAYQNLQQARFIAERQEAEARISRLNQLYVALSQCNQSIVHSKSTDELLPKICRDVVKFGGLKMAWIGLVDEATGAVRPAASYGEGTDYLEGVKATTDARDAKGRGPTGTSIRENRPVWCQDFQNDPMTAPWHEPGARYGWMSAASLPVHLGGQAIGAFVMYGDKPNAFDEEVRHLLVEMVNEIDFALESFAREEDRRRGEEALRESEERFRLMLQHMSSVSVQGYYMDGTTHYWNDASEALYGYSAEEAIGKNLLDLIIPPEMRDGVSEAIKMMGETLVPVPASELTLRRKDGSRVTVYSSHAVIWRHGHDPELFCIDVDLTDRKLAEESLKELNSYLESATVRAEELAVKAESAARAKSEFLALMSHELRTPLNGVLGFAELLSATRLDEEQQEYAKTILDSGNHLLDVVNDILDFSSIEKGRMQIESAPIIIAALVETTCRPIRKAAADKGLEFRCVMAGDGPAEITGDGRRIRQILINLLGNAVKFTQQGSVVLVVSPASVDGCPALDFSVEDTGPGITQETLGRLFKPFTQADTTVSRQFEGTGLGLAISRRLAEAMGGTLGVESTPGLGSKFTFRLPLDHPPHPLPVEEISEPPPATDSGGLPRVSGKPTPPEVRLILVVEDDAANRMLAGKMLEHLGCRVEFATNGEEAVDAFLPEKYSAILMDMQMPVMDGMEATRKIRELESGERTPIIALTANVMPGDRELCLEGGMDEFLSKPFKLGDLERMLARFLPS